MTADSPSRYSDGTTAADYCLALLYTTTEGLLASCTLPPGHSGAHAGRLVGPNVMPPSRSPSFACFTGACSHQKHSDCEAAIRDYAICLERELAELKAGVETDDCSCSTDQEMFVTQRDLETHRELDRDYKTRMARTRAALIDCGVESEPLTQDGDFFDEDAQVCACGHVCRQHAGKAWGYACCVGECPCKAFAAQ